MEPWDPHNPTIFIDHRERPSGLVEALAEGDFFEIEERALEVCDLQIGEVGFERKTGQDLIASLHDGRLFRQLILMRRIYRRRVLLIEGDVPVQLLPMKSQEGLWTRIAIGLQTPILRTQDVGNTARILRRAAFQIYGLTSMSAQVGAKPRDGDRRYFQTLALVSIPGIGLTRAKSLLARFGSLKAVLNANREELLMVDGIGPYHADLLIDVVTQSSVNIRS